MKKTIAIVACVAAMLFAGKANAQLGIHAGYSPESWTNENNNTELTTIFAGVDYNMPLTGNLMVSVGGQLRFGTESGSGNFFGISNKHSTTLIGIDVPVLFNFGVNLNSDLRLTFFAGPKVSYYLSGKTEIEGSFLGIIGGSGEEDWFDQSGLVQYNALNISGTFGLAFEFKQFRLFGGYNYGLLDMDNNDNTKTTISGLFGGFGIAL